MKRLLRRMSRVTDSNSSSSCSPLLPQPKPSRGRRFGSYYTPRPESVPVPAGHLPLRVEDPEGGGTSRRFVVPADLLTAPAIAALLRRSAQEYGYEQSGVLRIPCPVEVFQRVLDSLLAGGGDPSVEEWCLWDDDEEELQEVGWSSALQRRGAEFGWCC